MVSSEAAPEDSEAGGASPLPSAQLAWAMLEGLSTPLCLRDDKSRYVWANAAFQSAFGRGLAVIGYERDPEGNGKFLLGCWDEDLIYTE